MAAAGEENYPIAAADSGRKSLRKRREYCEAEAIPRCCVEVDHAEYLRWSTVVQPERSEA